MDPTYAIDDKRQLRLTLISLEAKTSQLLLRLSKYDRGNHSITTLKLLGKAVGLQ